MPQGETYYLSRGRTGAIGLRRRGRSAAPRKTCGRHHGDSKRACFVRAKARFTRPCLRVFVWCVVGGCGQTQRKVTENHLQFPHTHGNGLPSRSPTAHTHNAQARAAPCRLVDTSLGWPLSPPPGFWRRLRHKWHGQGCSRPPPASFVTAAAAASLLPAVIPRPRCPRPTAPGAGPSCRKQAATGRRAGAGGPRPGTPKVCVRTRGARQIALLCSSPSSPTERHLVSAHLCVCACVHTTPSLSLFPHHQPPRRRPPPHQPPPASLLPHPPPRPRRQSGPRARGREWV